MSRENVRKGAPGSVSVETAASVAVRRALVERLHTLAAPHVAEKIVDAACAQEGLVHVPEGGLVLSLFVHGPLREQTVRVLGEDAADALLDDLAPMVRMSQVSSDPDESQIRVTVRPAPRARSVAPIVTPVAPAPLDSFFDPPELARHARVSAVPVAFTEPPVVVDVELEEIFVTPFVSGPVPTQHADRAMRIIVASSHEGRVAEIASAMGGSVVVQRVGDVIELFDAAQAYDGEDVVVVLDSAEATVQPETLAAAHTDLPDNTDVVLWGTESTASDELEAMVPEAEQWTKLSESTSPSELAFFLRYALQQQRGRQGR